MSVERIRPCRFVLGQLLAATGAVALASEADATEEASGDVSAAQHAAAGEASWSSGSALTMPAGRWEVALFGQSHYGLADGFELSLQPLWFFVLPHAELKARVLERGAFSLALRPRVSYPSPFLSLIAREGAGGLLPNTTDVPFAVLLEADVIVSYRAARAHIASAQLGLAVGPHAASDELPLLDFPFLYPRFAALYAGAVPRLGVGLEGHVVAHCFYSVGATAYLLPLDDVDGAYALEPSGELEYRFGERVALDLGLRASIARYPIGTRFHYLPYADVKVGF